MDFIGQVGPVRDGLGFAAFFAAGGLAGVLSLHVIGSWRGRGKGIARIAATQGKSEGFVASSEAAYCLELNHQACVAATLDQLPRRNRHSALLRESSTRLPNEPTTRKATRRPPVVPLPPSVIVSSEAWLEAPTTVMHLSRDARDRARSATE